MNDKWCRGEFFRRMGLARDVLVPGLISLAMIVLAGPVLAGLESAKEAFKRGDEAEAVREIMSLADAGDVEAQFHLGELYQNGRGVPQDDQHAHDWYMRAAEEGHARAQFQLGFLYYNGLGVRKSLPEALMWYRLSANKGDIWAQNNVGLMYRDGVGAAKDWIKAYMWLSLAADQGFIIAKKNRDEIAGLMEPEEISRAKGMLDKFRSRE